MAPQHPWYRVTVSGLTMPDGYFFTSSEARKVTLSPRRLAFPDEEDALADEDSAADEATFPTSLEEWTVPSACWRSHLFA